VPEVPGAIVEEAAPMLPVATPALLPGVVPPNVVPALLPEPKVLLPVAPEPKVLLPSALLPAIPEEPSVLPVFAPSVPGAAGLPGNVLLPVLPKVFVQGVPRVEVPVVCAAAKLGRVANAEAATAAANCLANVCMVQTPQDGLRRSGRKGLVYSWMRKRAARSWPTTYSFVTRERRGNTGWRRLLQ
jgi:hypothetical protein